MVRFFEAVARAQPDAEAAGRAVAAFAGWLERDLILEHQKNPRAARQNAAWTGLAGLVPQTARVRSRYRHYPLYEPSRVDELWAAMYRESARF